MASEEDLVKLAVFLSTSYGAGKLAEQIHVSPIIGFITVGALLGPPLAGFAPSPYGAILSGLLGIQLSVIGAGLGTDLDDLRQCAFRAVLVAVLGVLFPVAGACLVLCIADVLEGNFETSRSLKTAFAAGSAIAPTSLGVTARLLSEVGELGSPLGQLVSVAAVFDDVISLVLLAQVKAIANEEPGVWGLIQPVVFSVIFILGSLLVALLLPWALQIIFRTLRVPERLLPTIGLWMLMLVATGATYSAIVAKTSFLLAGYLTGIAFGQLRSGIAKEPWKHHVEVHIEWLSILFFAATIGFVIPLKDLFTRSSLGIGVLLAVVAVLGKLACGLGLLPRVVDGVAVGVAMLGRGEFGFLIASQARAIGLFNERIYAATTWGVLVPTLLAPLIFGPIFRWRQRQYTQSHELDRLDASEESGQQLHDLDGIQAGDRIAERHKQGNSDQHKEQAKEHPETQPQKTEL